MVTVQIARNSNSLEPGYRTALINWNAFVNVLEHDTAEHQRMEFKQFEQLQIEENDDPPKHLITNTEWQNY
jgi:hypothetical protein